MLSLRPSSRLEKLRAVLDDLPQVAERAVGFHEARQALETRLDEASGRRLFRVTGEEIEVLDGDLRRLAAFAEDLLPLLAGADDLLVEIRELEARARDKGSPEVTEHILRSCRGLAGELAGLGTKTAPGNDLALLGGDLERLEGQLRRTFQALFWLDRLEETLDGFDGGPPEDAVNAAAAIRDRLATSGPTAAWLQEIRERLGEIEALAAREAKRPEALRTLSRLLPLLRRWGRELGREEDAVRRLAERQKEIEMADWETSLPAELLDAAQKLESRLLDHAATIRREHLDELVVKASELAKIGGEPSGFRERLEKLEGRAVPRPEAHRRWFREAIQARELLGAAASTHRAELENRLAGRLGEIEETLAPLRLNRLCDAVAADAERLGQEAARLVSPATADALLRALDGARALGEEAAALGARAREEEHRLFLVACGERLEELLAPSREWISLLAEIAPEDPRPELPSLVETASPDAAAKVVEAAADLLADLGERGVAAAEKLLEDRRRAIEELPVLEGLASEDQDAAAALLADLEALPEALPEDLDQITPASLEPVVRRLTRVEMFRRRLVEDRRAVAERRNTLRRRLQAFHDDGLRRRVPHWAARVAALVYGLPDPPPPTRSVRHQLCLAEELFGEVERQACRLEARAVEEGVRTLRRRGGDDPRIGRCLERLEELGPSELPPLPLRQQLEELLEAPPPAFRDPSAFRDP